MIRLTLDEKYKGLVDDLVGVENPNISYFLDNYTMEIQELAEAIYGDTRYNNRVKVVERIHSADGIEFTEKEYYWRFKSDKIFPQTWLSIYEDGDLRFTIDTDEANRLTESDLKEALESTGLPFDAFERVENDGRM